MSIPRFADTVDTVLPPEPPASDALSRRYPPAPDHFSWEPSSRWVRGVVDGVAIVDSRHQILVWEPRHKVPEYGFPLAHVRTDLLEPADRPATADAFYRPSTPDVQWFDLVVGGRRIPGAAWKWNTPGLEGYIAVNWFHGVLDDWFEEDEPVMTHPRDPHSRVDVLPSSRHVQVRLGERLLAESDAPLLLFETGLPVRFYLPREDVRWDELVTVDTVSECPYKGYADGYWAAVDAPEREIAWSYSDPKHQVSAIAGHVAFYNERVEIVVDGTPLPRDEFRNWA